MTTQYLRGLALALSILAGARAARAADAAPPADPIAALQSRVQALEAARAQPDGPPDPRRELAIGGYVQGQYEHHQDSEDQLRQGGALLNRDRFLVRRGRLKVEREWELASLMIELDGNTTNGPAFALWHAEPSLLWRGTNPSGTPPMVKVTVGLFDTPFGFELVESPRTRLFVERSVVSRALFPSEPDVGARLSGALGWFRYAFALVDGQPAGVRDYALQAPHASKDFVARVGGEAKPNDDVELAFGVSFLDGQGFHKGTDATKNGVVWRDANENGQIDAGELQAVPGQAATPSANFSRWALGGDARLRVRTRLGWTSLGAEIVFASNLDRALVVADPVLTGIDAREIGYALQVVQQVGDHVAVGLRHDYYDPNADYLDRQAGRLLPATQRIRTWSPVVAALLPGRARLVFEYDAQRNFFARDARGVPTNLAANVWTLRLQVEL